jgi:hypothetical protein
MHKTRAAIIFDVVISGNHEWPGQNTRRATGNLRSAGSSIFMCSYFRIFYSVKISLFVGSHIVLNSGFEYFKQVKANVKQPWPIFQHAQPVGDGCMALTLENQLVNITLGGARLIEYHPLN